MSLIELKELVKMDNVYVGSHSYNHIKLNELEEKKMLLFDEMKKLNKIKIYNKYAKYPKLSKLKNKFFFKGAEIFEGNNFEPKIKENDPLYDEINTFLKKNTIIFINLISDIKYFKFSAKYKSKIFPKFVLYHFFD